MSDFSSQIESEKKPKSINLSMKGTAQEAHPHVIAFLEHIFPESSVHFTQQNRVSMAETPCVYTTFLRSDRLFTNRHYFDTESNEWVILEKRKVEYQVDIYGEGAGIKGEKLATLWRDEFSVNFFKRKDTSFHPIYEEPININQFLDGSDQYEERYVMRIAGQVENRITYPMEYADSLGEFIAKLEA